MWRGPMPPWPSARSRAFDRVEREEREAILLAEHATRSSGAGHRLLDEAPDPNRTCFERDLDRIQHSRPFRRLAGKCQVYLAPDDDHLRTRLTHAIEVGQVAASIARATRLNEALTLASAAGPRLRPRPCRAMPPRTPCRPTSTVATTTPSTAPMWSSNRSTSAPRRSTRSQPLLEPARPSTPEGEVVAWADRIAYVCHDFEDAVVAGVVSAADLPAEVVEAVGTERRVQLGGFIHAMVETIAETGRVGMRQPEADALAAFRAFNYERIYLRPESVAQADRVNALLRSSPSGSSPTREPSATAKPSPPAHPRPRPPPSSTSAA